MRRLLEMDYIIDLQHTNSLCREYFFHAMKINATTIPHSNSNTNSARKMHEWQYYTELEKLSPRYSLMYETLNTLDIKLYQLSSTLIDLDCKFLQFVGAFGAGTTTATATAQHQIKTTVTAHQIKIDKIRQLQKQFEGHALPTTKGLD